MTASQRIQFRTIFAATKSANAPIPASSTQPSQSIVESRFVASVGVQASWGRQYRSALRVRRKSHDASVSRLQPLTPVSVFAISGVMQSSHGPSKPQRMSPPLPAQANVRLQECSRANSKRRRLLSLHSSLKFSNDLSGSGRLGRPQPSKLLQVGFDSHGPLQSSRGGQMAHSEMVLRPQGVVRETKSRPRSRIPSGHRRCNLTGPRETSYQSRRRAVPMASPQASAFLPPRLRVAGAFSSELPRASSP